MQKRPKVTFARRVTSRIIKPYISATNLSTILAVRKLEDRDKFQYRVVFEDGTTKDFLNFKQLQWYADTTLRNKNKYIILTRSDVDVEIKGSTC